jgi:hypothetical protein
VKYTRRCHCSRNCGHFARGTDALQPAERLLQLEPVLAVLIDAADAYDSDGLAFDPECGVHGERSVSNVECSCKGDLTSALEFVQALILDVRSARRNEPAGRPGRKDAATVRALSLSVAS